MSNHSPMLPNGEKPQIEDITERWIQDALSRGEIVKIAAYGGSMRPWIRSGDCVFIKAVTLNQIRIGDVLYLPASTRLKSQKALIHRVLWFNKNSLWTKGDSLLWFDQVHDLNTNSCVDAAIIGRVTHWEREGRYCFRIPRVVGLLSSLLYTLVCIFGVIRMYHFLKSKRM